MYGCGILLDIQIGVFCRGDILKKVILYIHGKGGSHLEAEQYKKNCSGFDIIGIDYNDYLPWIVQNQIKEAYENAHKRYDHIYVIANSIGAYFAMHTLQACDIEKALFISPMSSVVS